jgi:hypothetical protein
VSNSSNPGREGFITLLHEPDETHVLSAIRREHRVRLDRVRAAIDYLRERFHIDHPLAEYVFETDGIDLFVDKYGQLINVSRHGQLEMNQLIAVYLRRIERDRSGYLGLNRGQW